MRLLALLALACSLASATLVVVDQSSSLKALTAWVLQAGGSAPGAVVGRACPTCPRGVFARKALKRGEVVITVPLALALPVSQHKNLTADPAAYTAGEYARELLLRLHTDAAFNATWGVYWATLPAELFRGELFNEEHQAMLQSATMAMAADAWRQQAELVYNGSFASTFTNTTYPPLTEALPHVSLQEFLNVLALIFTRTFSPHVGGDVQVHSPYMLPLVDLVNHAPEPNAFYTIARGSYHVLASRTIQQGEELTFNYRSNNLHRPDGAIMGYGFVPPSSAPLLCSIDLPADFNGALQTDPAYEDPDSPYASTAERDRLAALLTAAPTSEDQDAALLASGQYEDWREEAILHFRIQRKKSLRLALETLDATLAAKGGAGVAAARATGNEL